MTTRVGEMLAQRAGAQVIGRERELEALAETLEPGGPLVTFVHGIAGVGKSSLLQAFSTRARLAGATPIMLDCRQIEPTVRGFLAELGLAIGGEFSDADEAANRLGTLGARVVLMLDTYEVFRLMDTWLRQVFIAALPAEVRIVLAGREPPVAAWLTAPGWQGLFQGIAIEPLAEADAIELLERAGVARTAAQRINRFTRGHPLALTLAASGLAEHDGRDLEDVATQGVIEALTGAYIEEITDPVTRLALEASSGIRRVTESLLHALLPNLAQRDTYERLQALPFVRVGRDGLVIHDAVRQAIAARMRASDPQCYRDYRRRAWECLRAQIDVAPQGEMWRYTADALYLIEHPVIREAFFPSGAQPLAVEPALPQDAEAIARIIERHEGPESARLLLRWWQRHAEGFRVTRDRDSVVVGLYVMGEYQTLDRSLLKDDPVAAKWLAHLREQPVARGERVLFIRRWLDVEQGELPGATQAACWLDIKRAYMEMRTELRRVYLAPTALDVYGEVATSLGFQIIDRGTVTLDGRPHHPAALDFGPDHVDGWFARHVERELGIDAAPLLDRDARAVRADGETVPLTPHEFAVMALLDEHRGGAVPRAELIEHVWGYADEGASNVVDVVVRSLRKKLGSRASLLETARGVGYRLRADR